MGKGGNCFPLIVVLNTIPQTPQPVTGFERANKCIIRHGDVGHFRHNFIETLHLHIGCIALVAGGVINGGHITIFRQEQYGVFAHMRSTCDKLRRDKPATAKSHQHTKLQVFFCHFLPVSAHVRHNRDNRVLNRSTVLVIDRYIRSTRAEHALITGKIHVVLQVIARVHHTGGSGVGKRAESSKSSQQGTTERKVQMQLHDTGKAYI